MNLGLTDQARMIAQLIFGSADRAFHLKRSARETRDQLTSSVPGNATLSLAVSSDMPAQHDDAGDYFEQTGLPIKFIHEHAEDEPFPNAQEGSEVNGPSFFDVL